MMLSYISFIKQKYLISGIDPIQSYAAFRPLGVTGYAMPERKFGEMNGCVRPLELKKGPRCGLLISLVQRQDLTLGLVLGRRVDVPRSCKDCCKDSRGSHCV